MTRTELICPCDRFNSKPSIIIISNEAYSIRLSKSSKFSLKSLI